MKDRIRISLEISRVNRDIVSSEKSVGKRF